MDIHINYSESKLSRTLKLLIIIGLLVVPVNSLYALQTLKLVLLPLNSTESLTDTRDKFSEQLRVELINSQEFIVIDPFVVREAMIEQGVVIGGDIDRQAVIEVGKGVNADIVLSGSLGREGETYRLTLDMISTVKGQSVYAETYDISDKSYVKDIRSLTEQLVEHGRLITQITLEDVKTLLEVGQFKEAQYALRTYLDFHEENNSVAPLQEMVHEGLARSAYEAAQDYLDNYLFADALVSINEALSYQPENKLYLEFVKTIQRSKIEFEQARQAELLSSLEHIVEQQQYETAASLIEIMYNRGYDSTRLQELHEQVRSGTKEVEYFQNAQRALWEHDYVTARLAIRRAIQLNPKEDKYHAFLQKLEEEESEYTASRTVWREYRAEFQNIDRIKLFRLNKHLMNGFSVGMIFNNFTYRDKNTLNEEDQGLIGFETYYSWHRLLPNRTNLSALSIYYVLRSGMRVSYGDSEEYGVANASGFRDITQERTLYGEGFGAAGAKFSLFSYVVSLFAELNSGGLYMSDYFRSPGIEIENTTRKGYFGIGSAIGTDFTWTPTETTHITVGYRSSWNIFYPESEQEQFRFSTLSFTYGWAVK